MLVVSKTGVVSSLVASETTNPFVTASVFYITHIG